jgi:hypothetical protein
MIDREEARRLLEASFDHLDREAAADTEEARAAAQEALLKVINDFFDCAGWRDSLYRQAVTFILGKPKGSPSQGSELASLIKNTRNFRRALAWLLYVLRLLPTSRKTVWSLVAAEEGREGGHGGGGVFEPDPVAGIDKTGSAAIENLKINLVEMVGYTAGALDLPETRRLPHELVQRAHEAWRRHSLRRTGEAPDPVKPATIRIWCTRPGRLADVFDAAYERGRQDKRANRVNRSKLLARPT